jgi:hypothetical protein
MLPQGITGLTPLPRENVLLVRGEIDAISEFKRVLRLVDTPPKLLELTVGVSGPGPNGKPFSLRSSGRVVYGEALEIDERAQIGGHPAQVAVTLRPLLQGDGVIQVAGDWRISLPVAGGPKGPVLLVKRLKASTLLKPGRIGTVGEVDLSAWGGTGVLRIWVRGEFYGGDAESLGRIR